MKTILVFGNELVKIDNLIFRILPKLKKLFPEINFVHIDPTEDLTKFGKDLTIIDVFHEINSPLILKDLEKLEIPKLTSMHDFDLSYNLKLLKSVGKIEKIKIYGLPFNMDEEKAIEWLKGELN